ncbi:MAG: TonB-dependent receptor domain-containing protein [Candidatus Eiseniibacteriota bacterium]
MRNRTLFLLALTAAVLSAAFAYDTSAQDARGRVTGKVLAKETGEPLPYADVLLIPADSTARRVGSQTNADGTFTLEAGPGVYTLQIRSLSYRTKQVTGVVLIAGKTDNLNVQLDSEAILQQGVEVEARAVTNNEGALLSQRKKAAAVGDAVSAEQVKKSPDRDAADVIKRVTGASVVDNKYVYVRGLGERYSSTSIDGVRVTSPEPNKRVVPLDLVPANLLDNVVVQKTYTADRPGEFGGGDVQVMTKAFPGERTFGFSLSQGWVGRATFQKSFQSYDQGHGDFAGFGTSARSLPDLVEELAGDKKAEPGSRFDPKFSRTQLEQMGASFDDVWSPRSNAPAMNGSAQVNFGDELKVLDRPVGLVGSLSWSRNYASQIEVQRFYQVSADQDTNADYHVVRYTENVLFGGTGGVSMRLTPAHSLSLRATYSNSAEDEVRQYKGYYKTQDDDYLNTRLRYVQRELLSGSLGGDHDLPELAHSKLSWKASFSASSRDEPDRREYTYFAPREVDGSPAPDLNFTGGGREFGDLDEDGRGLEARMGLPIKAANLPAARLEFGASWQDKDRVSTYRRFSFTTPANYGTATPPESIFAQGEWSDTLGGVAFVEGTLPDDAYDAEQTVAAAFVSGDVSVTRRVRAIAGLRVENGVQSVRTYDQFTGATTVDGTTGRVNDVELDNTDLLPSLNVIYALDDLTNVRVAAARTLSRPDVRELNPGTTNDFIGGFRFRGNADLERATMWNYDLRVERFPTVNEVLAVSLFYKDFSQPIEYAILPSDQPVISPVNSESGRNYGVEIESRMGLGRFRPELKGFSVNLNLSLIDSKIEVGQGLGTQEHPLQGQSNFLLNAGVGYVSRDARWDANALVNTTGRRLMNLGYAGIVPDIYDDPVTTVDLSANYRLTPHWRFKLTGSNLLDSTFRSFQGEKLYRSYQTGRSITLSAAFGS